MFHPKGPTFFELVRQGLSSTRKGYDLLAPKFDYTPFATPACIVDATVRYLKPYGPFADAADLCTGTGAGISGLRGIVTENITGFDFSYPMLQEARKKFSSFPKPHVWFEHIDVYGIWHREKFDLATCFGALGHIEKHRYQEFVAKVHDILRPGGLFAFITMEKPSLVSPSLWFLWMFDTVMKIRNFFIRPKFIMYYLNFLLPEVRGLFGADGWASVDIIPVDLEGQPTPLRLVIARKK